MSDELVPFDFNALAKLDTVSQEEIDSLTETTNFLQRVQLVTKGKYVDNGLITPGHYGVPQIGGEEILDLGASIDILPIALRSKALDMSDRNDVVAVYDRTSSEFEDIKNRASTPNSGCMWGPSYLIYERSTAKFYEFFMGTVSQRMESGKLAVFLPLAPSRAEANGVEPHGPLPCTLSSRYIKPHQHGWHVPVVTACSEPISLPDTDVIRTEVERFIDAKDSGVQNVTAEESKATSRPQ